MQLVSFRGAGRQILLAWTGPKVAVCSCFQGFLLSQANFLLTLAFYLTDRRVMLEIKEMIFSHKHFNYSFNFAHLGLCGLFFAILLQFEASHSVKKHD